MNTSTIIIFLAIFLSTLSYIGLYYIAKSNVTCTPNCTNKKCGDTDNCGTKCKFCPSNYTCNTDKCVKQHLTENFDEPNEPNKPNELNDKYKGICYFDIDGTLNDPLDNTEDMMQECLDKNFDIGIITASTRTLQHICDENNNPKEFGIPKILCDHLHKNNGTTFNSLVEITGNKTLPFNYPRREHYGVGKAFSMIQGRDTLHPNIPDKCVVLFDNDPSVLNEVLNYTNHDLQVQCAGQPCSLDQKLSKHLIRTKLDQMISNGCK
jgi:hypothetical protein